MDLIIALLEVSIQKNVCFFNKKMLNKCISNIETTFKYFQDIYLIASIL